MKKTIYLRKTKTGPIVMEFPDLKAAKEALGIPANQLETLIKSGRRHDGMLVSHTGPKHVPRPQVDLYGKDGTPAGTFANQTEAALFAGVSRAMIGKCIAKPWRRTGGFYARVHGTKFEFVPKPKRVRK